MRTIDSNNELYIGYTEMINSVIVDTNLKNECEVRNYFINSSINHVKRLGNLTFEECKKVVELYSDGYKTAIIMAILDKYEKSELIRIHIENKHPLSMIEFSYIPPDLVRAENVEILHGMIESGFSDYDVPMTHDIILKIIQTDHSGFTLLYENNVDIDLKKYVKTYLMYYDISTLPEEFITDEIIQTYVINEILYTHQILKYMKYMNDSQISFVYKKHPELILLNKDYEQAFKRVYDKTFNVFTEEYIMMKSLLENGEGLKDEKNINLVKSKNIDINILYNAYNLYRVKRHAEELYYNDE